MQIRTSIYFAALHSSRSRRCTSFFFTDPDSIVSQLFDNLVEKPLLTNIFYIWMDPHLSKLGCIVIHFVDILPNFRESQFQKERPFDKIDKFDVTIFNIIILSCLAQTYN